PKIGYCQARRSGETRDGLSGPTRARRCERGSKKSWKAVSPRSGELSRRALSSCTWSRQAARSRACGWKSGIARSGPLTVVARGPGEGVESLLSDDVEYLRLLPLCRLDKGPEAVIDPHEVERLLIARKPPCLRGGPPGRGCIRKRGQPFQHLRLLILLQ